MMPCPLDPSVGVIFVDPTELGPTRLDNTHAFAVFGESVEEPFIVVDKRLLEQPWFTEDHLMVVLAHELAHILCRSENEKLADRIGMMLLQRAGLDSAYMLHRAEYESRLAAGHYQRAA